MASAANQASATRLPLARALVHRSVKIPQWRPPGWITWQCGWSSNAALKANAVSRRSGRVNTRRLVTTRRNEPSTCGATVADVRLMRATVGQDFGVKAAGGIRILQDALAMLEAGANRIGTSASAAILGALAT